MSEDWVTYERFVAEQLAANDCAVGGFSLSREELFWNILTKADMPPVENARPLILPLHIHLSRCEELGSDLTVEEVTDYLVPQLNLFWSFANVSFEIVKISDHEFTTDTPLAELKSQIWKLGRDPSTGRMMGKDTRRRIFLDELIGSTRLTPSTYDIWFFDLIGQKSQGCCIHRESRTIIMGRRSTKGYEEATRRPLACLAKTMAHELGHALDLNHPKGRQFRDGTSCLAATGKNNLMVGGIDATGGGGELLCPWQVLLARQSAMSFLASRQGTEKEEKENLQVSKEEEVVSGTEEDNKTDQFQEHVEESSLNSPKRTVLHLDALEWLKEFPDRKLAGEVFTSVPDISELHAMFPSPQKNNHNYKLYKDWFRETITLVLSKTPRYAIFLQTDIRALTGKDEKVLEFIDKSALIQEVAATCHFTLVWHKIVTNSERFAQKRVSHAPNWSHLICFRRESVSCDEYETRLWKTPDVFTRGEMTWERAVGLNAAMTGVSFLKHIAQTTTVVDPFCGLGTIVAVANALGLDSIGNDLSRKRAKKASDLDLRYTLCSLTYKQREHYGVTERLPYDKYTVPKPYVWSSSSFSSSISSSNGAPEDKEDTGKEMIEDAS